MNKASIWKDKIILSWDGVLPPNTPSGAIHSNEDVVHFWEHLNGFIKWSVRMNAYVMNLSLQNIDRLNRQFPNLQWRSQDEVHRLRAQKSFFYKMIEMANKVKNLPFDRLPKYDYKVPPLGEYQHRGVVFLRNVKRAPLFADCGCLAGDTIISISRARAGRKVTIRDLFKSFHGSRAKTNPKVRSYDGDIIKLHDIYDVVESGVKPVYKLTLEDGKSIKATEDHLIKTNLAWIPLGYLTTSDYVMVDNLTRHSKAGSGRNFNHGVPEYSRVVSVEYVGEEMTYDICCEDPHHNFVANGMVVHNSGKTFMVLTSTELQIKKGEIQPGKTLICGKLATLREGWEKDAKKFTDLNVKTLWLPTGIKNRRERIIELLNSPADAYVINHDGLRLFEAELTEKRFSKVVIDESTILKNFHGLHKAIKGGQFGRALMSVAASADYRVIMSGTPAPNGPDDFWGQMYFLDPDGITLEPSFNDFRQEYMQLVDLRPKNRRMKTDSSGQEYYVPPGPKDPKEWMPKKDMVERVGGLVNPLSYRIKIRDHLKDLPQCTQMKRMVEMTKEQKIHYKDMLDKLKVVIDDVRITVPVKLTQIMKLRQITGGFIIDNEEVAHVIPDNPKLEELDSLLEEIGKENKVVIYAQYQWEIKLIESRYKDRGAVTVYGGNSSERNLKNISTFINDEACKMIVLHPKSAAHGITFTMAHYMIFYSIDHSAEDNYQCVKRIDRAGQKLPTFVYYLLCEGSIDKTIYQVVIDKLKDQEELLSQQSLDQLIIDLWRENEAS